MNPRGLNTASLIQEHSAITMTPRSATSVVDQFIKIIKQLNTTKPRIKFFIKLLLRLPETSLLNSTWAAWGNFCVENLYQFYSRCNANIFLKATVFSSLCVPFCLTVCVSFSLPVCLYLTLTHSLTLKQTIPRVVSRAPVSICVITKDDNGLIFKMPAISKFLNQEENIKIQISSIVLYNYRDNQTIHFVNHDK